MVKEERDGQVQRVWLFLVIIVIRVRVFSSAARILPTTLQTKKKMLFSAIISFAAIVSTTTALHEQAAGGIVAQQILEGPLVVPDTTITSTRTIHVTFTTTTHIYRADATGPAPSPQRSNHLYSAVPTWYGGQRNHGCDGEPAW